MKEEELRKKFIKLDSFKDNYDCNPESKINLIKFKTGGMRALMKEGFDGINQVTANMLGTILESKFNSIVIGFDHRVDSDRFAFIIAKIFKNKPVKVFKHCTTPYLAWESLNFDVGLMITASHNPKEFNGFKVYVEGSQIVNPLDLEIESEMQELPFTNIFNFGFENNWQLDLEKLYSPINYEGFFKSYEIEKNTSRSQVVPIFSGLYGVSSPFISKACEFFNIKINMNSIQNTINCEFPNIPFPNPELSQPWELLISEVNLSVKPISTSDYVHNCRPGNNQIIFDDLTERSTNINYSHKYYFMCDPDGDRFGMAETKNGKIRIFNGNEISKIFLYHFLKKFKNSEIGLISTFLCDDFFKIISEQMNIKYVNTKTGFKNVSKAVKELRKDNLEILAYEDTLGYLMGKSTERDGVKAVIMMNMILQEITPDEVFEYFNKFGEFHSYSTHIRIEDPKATLSKVLNRLEFESIHDGYFRFEDKFKIMLRISGTESMLKIYTFTQNESEESLKKLVDEWIAENVLMDSRINN